MLGSYSDWDEIDEPVDTEPGVRVAINIYNRRNGKVRRATGFGLTEAKALKQAKKNGAYSMTKDTWEKDIVDSPEVVLVKTAPKTSGTGKVHTYAQNGAWFCRRRGKRVRQNNAGFGTDQPGYVPMPSAGEMSGATARLAHDCYRITDRNVQAFFAQARGRVVAPVFVFTRRQRMARAWQNFKWAVAAPFFRISLRFWTWRLQRRFNKMVAKRHKAQLKLEQTRDKLGQLGRL